MSEENNIEEGLVDTAGKMLIGGAKALKSKLAGGPKMQVTTPAGKTFNMPRGATSTNVSPAAATQTGSGLKPVGVGTAVAAGTGVGAGVYGYQKAKEYANTPDAPAKTTSTEKPVELPKIDVKADSKTPSKPMSFSQAFKSAREKATEMGHPSTGQFEFQGKKFQTNVAGEKYVPTSKQTSVASEPKSDSVPLPPKRPTDLTTKTETESGKKEKKMSEETNPLIAAFLKLQDENPSNMFEAAKKAKKDYDKDGKVESPKDEVWGSRFAAAKKAGKMEEAAVDAGSVEGSKSVTKDKPKEDPSTPKSYPGAASSLTPDNPTTKRMSNAVKEEEEVEIEEGRTTGNRSYKGSPDRKRKAVQMALGRKHKDHPDWNERTSPQYSALKLGRQLQKQGVTEEEEVTFSQEEIDHINSFFLEASVAPTRPEVATGADSTSDKMSQNDVTGTAESGKKIHEKLTDEAKAKVKTALSDKMKKSSAPARALIKLAKSNPSNVKEETLEEGRPKKNPVPETTERDPRKHIQVEAGRAAAGNVVDFHHNDGSKSKITPAMGRKITSHLQGLKPADRQAAVNKMHDSAEGLKV